MQYFKDMDDYVESIEGNMGQIIRYPNCRSKG